MNMYKVFTLKLANELVKRNFEIKDWEINRNQPNLKVFLFEDTIKLRSEIIKIKQENTHRN
ncbi:MAG: hypothetical protein ACRDBY_04865 [Cetobacterium sp.]